ncbi:MAG: TIGR03885 family FMN-dependent LLM class oxidoreductase [Chloroflexi bacterium]|nr:TIGR03885 family FMN-dependent LLM class oxidoreductase [Chloroflexota bacterium]
MIHIGYHASHEQFRPSELLDYVQRAEQAGFTAAMCSDHFFPWSESQGQSGFTWSWLGAALQATGLSFGTVNAPGQRYHPAIIAQAAATLAEMYPGRFWLAVGSGEWVNEHITGERWPTKAERNQRLQESVAVMRALWAGETVTHRGLIEVEEARLYTRPAEAPMVVGAAVTAPTAAWVAGWADALITVNRPPDQLAEVVQSFREGGGEVKPMFLQVHVAWAPDDAIARQEAYEQWRTNVFDSTLLADLKLPEQFEAAAKMVRPEDLDSHVLIASDPARYIEWLQAYLDLGFSRLYIHNVTHRQPAFIEMFGERVLPALLTAERRPDTVQR